MKIEDELKSSFKNDYHKLVVNLLLTYMRLSEPFQELLKVYGLTSTQYNVLRILSGQKQVPASIGLIKERMIERNSDVSRVIDRLLKKKLIERRENKNDRRQRDILINAAGLEVLEKIDAHENDYSALDIPLSSDEVAIMNELLDKMRSNPSED